MKNNSVSQKQVYEFIKINGVKFLKGVSIWELTSMALIKCGIEKDDSETDKYFVDRNKSIIMEQTVGVFSRAQKRRNKKNELKLKRSIRNIEVKKLTKPANKQIKSTKIQTSQEFLKSWEWTTLRMEAIKLSVVAVKPPTSGGGYKAIINCCNLTFLMIKSKA